MFIDTIATALLVHPTACLKKEDQDQDVVAV
jgi:hypothetical protein